MDGDPFGHIDGFAIDHHPSIILEDISILVGEGQERWATYLLEAPSQV